MKIRFTRARVRGPKLWIESGKTRWIESLDLDLWTKGPECRIFPLTFRGGSQLVIELNCNTCGNNRFNFPEKDSEPVTCQFCGESLGTQAEVKQKMADAVGRRSEQRKV
jgi:ribosomal protein S27E